jgi:hypothetical protein
MGRFFVRRRSASGLSFESLTLGWRLIYRVAARLFDRGRKGFTSGILRRTWFSWSLVYGLAGILLLTLSSRFMAKRRDRGRPVSETQRGREAFAQGQSLARLWWGATVSIDYVCHDFFRSEIWEMIWKLSLQLMAQCNAKAPL